MSSSSERSSVDFSVLQCVLSLPGVAVRKRRWESQTRGNTVSKLGWVESKREAKPVLDLWLPPGLGGAPFNDFRKCGWVPAALTRGLRAVRTTAQPPASCRVSCACSTECLILALCSRRASHPELQRLRRCSGRQHGPAQPRVSRAARRHQCAARRGQPPPPGRRAAEQAPHATQLRSVSKPCSTTPSSKACAAAKSPPSSAGLPNSRANCGARSA